MSRRLPALLGHEVPGQLAKAGRNCDLHPAPVEQQKAAA
jgi:hydroxymethylglutaryl-CoA lyase